MSAGGMHVPGTGVPGPGTGGHMKPASEVLPSPVPPSRGSPLEPDPFEPLLPDLPDAVPLGATLPPPLPPAPVLPLISPSLPLVEPVPISPDGELQPAESITRMGPTSHPPKPFHCVIPCTPVRPSPNGAR